MLSRAVCFAFHRYQIVKDTGKTVYRECGICGKRDVYQRLIGGYQPINYRWVDRLTNEIDTPLEQRRPPKGGSAMSKPYIYNPKESQSGPWHPHISRADKLRSEKELTIPVKYNPLHPAHNHGKR